MEEQTKLVKQHIDMLKRYWELIEQGIFDPEDIDLETDANCTKAISDMENILKEKPKQ